MSVCQVQQSAARFLRWPGCCCAAGISSGYLRHAGLAPADKPPDKRAQRPASTIARRCNAAAAIMFQPGECATGSGLP